MKSGDDTKKYDCHTHTLFSHDSQCDPRASCEAALQAGLAGIALTDHCDIEYARIMDVQTPILKSVDAAHGLNEQYGDRLEVLCGVELGEALFNPAAAKAVLDQCDYDMVLGSVHAVRGAQNEPYSHMDFSLWRDTELSDYLKGYFTDVLEMMQQFKIDVLAHLTCPLRYMVHQFGRSVDLTPFQTQTDAILNTVIAQNIALEVNTSATNTEQVRTLPDMSILQRYYDLGGRKITLASDAHVSARVGIGFRSAAAQLRAIGFREAYYYRQHMAIPYELSLE